MQIVKTELIHVPQVCALYDEAKKYFKENNINQWQEGGPDENSLAQDIQKSESFVVLRENEVLASFMYSEAAEPTYSYIYKGAWKYNGAYAVIHRVAVSPLCKGRGIMAKIVEFAENNAKKANKQALRCDTHAQNLPMQRALLKNSFEYSGIIYLDDNKTDERLVYERALNR